MFRHQKMQRAISALVLITFTSLTLYPASVAAQTKDAAKVGTAGSSSFVPLQRRDAAPDSNAVLLPTDLRGLASGKGQPLHAAMAAKPALAISTDDYSQALGRLHDLVKQAVPNTSGGSGVAAQDDAVRAIGPAMRITVQNNGAVSLGSVDALLQANAIRAQYRAIQRLEAQASKSFAATEAHLRARALPSTILQRHQAAVADYHSRNRELRGLMASLDATVESRGDPHAALSQLAQFMDQYPSQIGQVQGNPARLPWGNSKTTSRQAALTPRQHERLFPRSVQVATAGTLSGISLPDAILSETPLPADLAETEDVQLTPEIRALAATLANNPVKLYNWVHNNVQYTPGYGALQGAAATLQAKRGNAFDTASLLIALYRAANIPARYVYGTIEVPAAHIQNWLGVDNMAAAQTLLTQAGIPNQSTVQSGQASTIQLEHVWVEAFVDYTPSRGAINKTPDTWVSVDPSFKRMQNQAGLDLRNAVSLNEAGVFDAVKQGASCTVDFGQSLNAVNLQTAYNSYNAQLSNYLTQQGADLTVGDVLGSQVIAADNYAILLGTLPYKTIAQGAILNQLPDHLRGKFRLQLFANAAAQGQAQTTVALTGSLASLAGKRITLSFAPATQADADTLASYMPRAHNDGSAIQSGEFPADIPGYLISVKAELRVDGQVAATGGSFMLGSELVAVTDYFDPATGNWNDNTSKLHAGDYQALAIDAQGVSAAQMNAVKARISAMQAKLASGQTATLTRDDVTGDVLYQTALGYFATADANAAVFQRAAGVVEQRLPSYGRAIAQTMPHMALGIVSKVTFPGVTLDIDRMSSAVAAQSGGLDAVAYARQSNERNAAYAHLALEKLYTNTQRPGEAASAVKALALAATQGQSVYTLNQANIAAILPLINISAAGRADLQNAVAAGHRVLVAQNPLTIGAWSGQAILMEDTTTGAGVYSLTGDSGAATAALYLSQGMGWLALAEPFQAASSMVPTTQAAQAMDEVLAAMLDGSSNTTRWSFFLGQADVINGLFLARLAGAQGSQACDSLVGILAANLGTTTGFDNTTTQVTAPPFISSHPVTAATAGQAYRYAVTATDPQGIPLTYRLADAPSGMSIGNTGLIAWDKPLAGSYTVTLRADNGRAYAEQRYLLSVGTAALPLEISLAVTPAIVNLGESVKITLFTNGGTGNISKTLAVDGQPVALDASEQATLTGSVMGAHRIVATSTDTLGTVTKESLYSVRDPADSTAPVAQIISPADDAEIIAPVDIIGTASDANLAYYQLLLRPSGNVAWQEIGRGTSSVANGVLGKLDPTQLQNGIYDLALNVVDANGRQTSQMVTLDIYRDLKIGQFSISFEDLNIEASGIPIRVTRTYDTRRKAEDLDFGYGWSVDYQSLQVRKNMVLGLQWNVTAKQFLLCLAPAGKRKINITLPTGKVERFTAANAQECAFGTIPPVDIQLTALPGTTSRLEIINVPSLLTQGGMLYDVDNFEPWNPKEFKLTTEDNYVFYLTDGIGITQIKDPSGNTLTYGQNGILHSNGQSVAFTRDAAGRITAITDPSGKKISYTYDARGDLTSVTDRTNAVARFSYNRSHGLVDYTDPYGIVTARYVYDADGRLIAAYDATGKAIETTHDLASNKEIVKDRRGNITTYTYDAAGNITEKVDALGNKTTYAYDANGNETSVKDAAGNIITRSFDAQSGKQLTEKDALNNSTSWSYDLATKTQLQSTTDARGNSTSYAYFVNGGQSISEPLGRSTSLLMDSKGNLNKLVVAGQTTTYTYDSKGNKTSETDAGGNVTTYAYDANNQEISRSWTRSVIVNGVPQPKTVTVTRKLDAEGRVLEETDALGFTTKTQYNAGGQVTASIDPQGRQTTYAYDSRGKLATTTYPDGTSEAITYDAESNQASTTDRQGRTTQYQYDALNRLTKTIAPDGSASGTEYDAVGRVAATIDANGSRTANTYDAAGRLIALTDANGHATQFSYDANGNRTQVTDAYGNITRYDYDALNRLVKTTTPDGKSATIVWRTDGRKQAETDAAGNTIEYGYGAVGRLTQVKQTNAVTAQVTSYSFDSTGNKISQTDAEGRTTKWEYDSANRVTSRTLPGGQKETFSYDPVGNLAAKTDFNGQVIRYGYNNLYQLNQVIRPDDSSIVTAYTASGQVARTTVTASANSGLQSGTTSYAYDAQDRLVKQTNPDGSFLAYGYDAAGNITERSTQAGTVTYSYDANQQLTSVTDSNGQTTSYTYDAVGRPATVVLPNGITTRYGYDINGRLLQLLHQQADGSLITGVRYTLAANGQRTTLEEFDNQSTIAGDIPASPARTTAYAYDGVGRLKEDKLTDRSGTVIRTTGYSYDKVGNRTQKTDITAAGTETTSYSFDANDRLTQESKTTSTGSQVNTSYTWDANGNLKSKTVGTQITLYGWNNDNRLIEVKQGTSAATAQTVARYTYDPSGNRIGKIEPRLNGQADKVTSYLTDATFPHAQTVQENVTQGSTTESTRYVWGNGLVAQSRGNQANYYHADGLGSVKALTDAAGNATDSYAYDAFGNVEAHTGATTNAYRYTSEYFDEAIGLQYNRARWVDASAGRFVSLDPFSGKSAQPISLNKYLYADGDPINLTDPSGYMSLGESGAASSVQGTLNSIAMPNIMRQFAGKAANRLGKAFTDKIEDAIKGCLKPGVKFKSGKNVPRIQTRDDRWAMPDFMFELGDSIKYLEAKTKLPGMGSLGDQFQRVGKQLQAAIDNKASIGVVTRVKHRDLTLEKRKSDILNTLTGDAGLATFINGLSGMVAFVGEYVIEECVEDALGF